MLVQALIGEFEHEVKNTRKLLQAIPEKDLGYRPSDKSWTMGELAQHIATIYYWYTGVLKQEVFDLGADKLERRNPDDINATIELFEKGVESARAALKSLTDEDLQVNWTMKSGDKTLIGPMPRGVVARNMLYNHVYHHRGEMIVYLRATGNRVPGLYGPTREEMGG